jgi:hypothetical protein
MELKKEKIYPTHLVDLENTKIINFDKQEYSILSYTWNNDNNIDWEIPEIIVSKNLYVLLWNDEKISEVFIKDHDINQENIYVYEDYIKEILLISKDIWKKATYSGDKI